MIARRSKLIYDFDDAMFASKSPEQNKKEGGNRHTIGKLNYILKKSSIVFAGSTDLVDYAATYNNNVHLMPTGLEAKVSEPVVAAEAGRVTIGWIGNDVNLFYLSAIDEALQVIQNKYPETRFSLMCGKKPEGLKTIWEFEAWSQEAETPWLHSIDIGIMPLTDDPWSRGKCAFKLLQYMSFGKPVVASNVGANRLAVQHAVNGYLASENEEWVKAIEKLIRDRNLRITMGRESLRIFTEQYERSLIQRKIADAIHTLGKLNAS
jgi:glycosyltransferase involved in cell wall biosynthesis